MRAQQIFSVNGEWEKLNKMMKHLLGVLQGVRTSDRDAQSSSPLNVVVFDLTSKQILNNWAVISEALNKIPRDSKFMAVLVPSQLTFPNYAEQPLPPLDPIFFKRARTKSG